MTDTEMAANYVTFTTDYRVFAGCTMRRVMMHLSLIVSRGDGDINITIESDRLTTTGKAKDLRVAVWPLYLEECGHAPCEPPSPWLTRTRQLVLPIA